MRNETMFHDFLWVCITIYAPSDFLFRFSILLWAIYTDTAWGPQGRCKMRDSWFIRRNDFSHVLFTHWMISSLGMAFVVARGVGQGRGSI